MENQRKENGGLQIKQWIRESVTRGEGIITPTSLVQGLLVPLIKMNNKYGS